MYSSVKNDNNVADLGTYQQPSSQMYLNYGVSDANNSYYMANYYNNQATLGQYSNNKAAAHFGSCQNGYYSTSSPYYSTYQPIYDNNVYSQQPTSIQSTTRFDYGLVQNK